MARSLEYPELHVEGEDDKHALIHLLARHGVVLDKLLGPVRIKVAQGDDSLLRAMQDAVKGSAGRSVGFVLDADVAIADRWRAIEGALTPLGVVLPASCPADGFIGESAPLKSRVGVWIMPDCATDFGKLEHLIQTLVPVGDVLLPHAEKTTGEARALGAAFAERDAIKALIHCWLAWQREPGLSFGHAIRQKYFSHDSAVAIRFVGWFTALFGLSP